MDVLNYTWPVGLILDFLHSKWDEEMKWKQLQDVDSHQPPPILVLFGLYHLLSFFQKPLEFLFL